MDTELKAELERMLDERFDALRTELAAHIDRLAEMTASGFASVHSRIDGLEQRLDAVEQRLDAVEQRLDAVEQRLDALDQRLDTMERSFDALRTRVTEGFISNEESFRSLEIRIEQFEARVAGELAAVRHELAVLSRRAKAGESALSMLGDRLEKLEADLLGVSMRLDGFADDMRQRFRVVNDRLATIAA